jgi:uncharacterized protein (TIGR03118 family)
MNSQQWLRRVVVISLGVLGPALGSWAQVTVTNLVTDNQGVNAALLADPDLVNPWGVTYSPSSPFWVGDNGTGLATLYNVNPVTNVPSKVGLTVTLPGNGTVTGAIFNSTSNFNSDLFLFVGEDGTVSGWRGALGTTAETLQGGNPANVYKGVTLGTTSKGTYIYAANFEEGTIDVTPGTGAPALIGNFTDPNLPTGFAPFNVSNLGGTLYVTYAKQDAAHHDDVPGAGNGFVDAFDLNGNFVERIASEGLLNSPWGLAIAPAGFDGVGGDLLVGNFGDGTIDAINLSTFASDGQIRDVHGDPIEIDGLWSLIPGNDGNGGNSSQVYFSAGSNGENDGLFGVLTVPEPGSLGVILIGFGALILRRRVA